MSLVLVALLFALSVLSGMLGIGVAFAAVPFLSLYLPDLVNQVQPLSLILNGVTAFFSLLGFAHAGLVDWKRGTMLSVVTTLTAPIGALLARAVDPLYIWGVYFAAVLYMCWRLIHPHARRERTLHFRLGLILAVPISIVTGFIGVGPGFLLMPALMMVGFSARSAAALNALAVTPSSFAAVLPHWSHMQLDPWNTGSLALAGAAGSLVGARLAITRVPEEHLRFVLLAVIASATVYRIARLLF